MKNLNLAFFLLITSTLFAQTELLSEKIVPLKKYDSEHLLRVALPLGGIGTGTVSLEVSKWRVLKTYTGEYRLMIKRSLN